MRHLVRGRQLSRDTEHRKSLRRSLVQSLFEHGKIRTTLPKAKEVKAFAEKLITLARTPSINSRRRVTAMLNANVCRTPLTARGRAVVVAMMGALLLPLAGAVLKFDIAGYDPVVDSNARHLQVKLDALFEELSRTAGTPEGAYELYATRYDGMTW